MKTTNQLYTLTLIFLLLTSLAYGQISTKVTQDKFDEYRDSLENAPRTYVLPIWGEKVQQMGYDLPLPAGLMFAFINRQQDLLLENLAIGPTGRDSLADISELVQFSQLRKNANVYTFRP